MNKQNGRNATTRQARATGRGTNNKSHDDSKSGPPVRRLARELKRVGRDSVAPIDHTECEAMLAWYVSDERNGGDMRSLYPAIWNHLRGCSRCAESYDLIKVGLETDFSRPLPLEKPPALSFLSERPFDKWRVDRSSHLSGRNPRVDIQFHPAFVHNLLHPARPTVASTAHYRHVDSIPVSESLLLNDEAPLGNQTLMVTAWLTRSGEATDRASIRFEVASPEPLPERLVARLLWDRQEYETPVKEGEGRFEHLPLPEFAGADSTGAANGFRLTFESRADEAA